MGENGIKCCDPGHGFLTNKVPCAYIKKVKKKNSQEDTILQFLVRIPSLYIYQRLCMVNILTMWLLLTEYG